MRTTEAGAFVACPITEPIAEPIWTMGPSRPQLPPNPIEVADAIDLIAMIRGRITPPRRATDSITSGTPCPFASGAKRTVIKAAIVPPIANSRIRPIAPRCDSSAGRRRPNASHPAPAIMRRKTTAPRPPPMPTSTAAAIIKALWEIENRPRRKTYPVPLGSNEKFTERFSSGGIDLLRPTHPSRERRVVRTAGRNRREGNLSGSMSDYRER